MGRGAGTDARERYDSALAGVWGDLGLTLSRLDVLAADPDALGESALEVLPHLQYSLHRAGELTAGLRPPAGREHAHMELAAALEDARDLTAEATDALESGGGAAVAMLVHEWRGSLFRVRMARHRLKSVPVVPVRERAEPRRTMPTAPLAATALVAAGVGLFAAGAVVGLWPVWAFGLALVAGGFFAYRP